MMEDIRGIKLLLMRNQIKNQIQNENQNGTKRIIRENQ